MATGEIKGFQNIISSIWTEDVMMRRMGYKRVEGLSFWVRANDLLWSLTPHEYNRPFTKKQHRAHVREQRRLRWVRRGREVKRRTNLVWDGLRGHEPEGDW